LYLSYIYIFYHIFYYISTYIYSINLSFMILFCNYSSFVSFFYKCPTI